MDLQLDGLKLDDNGLIPAIIQDAGSGQVLMMAWMNRSALDKTVATGKTHFFSRSRNKLRLKGESSGHAQPGAIHPHRLRQGRAAGAGRAGGRRLP